MAEHDTFHEEEFSGHVNWRTWSKVLRHAMAYKRSLAALAVCAAALAALDSTFPLLTKWILDAAGRGSGADLAGIAALYFGLVVVFAVTVNVFIGLAGRISTHVSHDIRRSLFQHLQDLSFSYFDRRPAGWLLARLTGDCDRLSRVIAWGTLDLIWSPCIMVGLSAVILYYHWKLGLILLAGLPPLLVLGWWFQQKILASSRRMRKVNSEITASFHEALMAARTTKTLAREDDALTEFQSRSGEMYQASVRNALQTALYLPLIFSMGSIAVGIVLWLGGVDVVAGTIRMSTLVMLMQASGQLPYPVYELARAMSDVQAAQAAAERVVALLETRPDVKDSAEVVRAIESRAAAIGAVGQEPPRAATLGAAGLSASPVGFAVGSLSRRDMPGDGLAADGLPDRIETIEFRNVSFSYASGPPVLSGFTLPVRAGQAIAMVGPTGGGKTTIISLLCRFYEPTEGEILINGVDYRKRSLAWWQSKLGVVLQTPHLFSGTVRENIRYGNLSASQEQIVEAARQVGAHGFIERLEHGYDSEVGPGGNRLSMGQKQLVSFARAVLADPAILIMDEATSSIDAQTEALIQAGMKTLLAGRTSFIIAHRLSTNRGADTILVIDGGRIVERGSHRGLIASAGRYFDLYTQQFQREEEDKILEQEQA